MHLFNIPQCSIQNRNVQQKCAHISVLNGALWDMEQVHPGIYEINLLAVKVAQTVSCICNKVLNFFDVDCFDG